MADETEWFRCTSPHCAGNPIGVYNLWRAQKNCHTCNTPLHLQNGYPGPKDIVQQADLGNRNAAPIAAPSLAAENITASADGRREQSLLETLRNQKKFAMTARSTNRIPSQASQPPARPVVRYQRRSKLMKGSQNTNH